MDDAHLAAAINLSRVKNSNVKTVSLIGVRPTREFAF